MQLPQLRMLADFAINDTLVPWCTFSTHSHMPGNPSSSQRVQALKYPGRHIFRLSLRASPGAPSSYKSAKDAGNMFVSLIVDR